MWLLFTMLEIPLFLNIILIFFVIVVLIIFGIFFYLIVSLPEKLSRNFDLIRNKIAAGDITSVCDFADQINTFILRQFNYVFFDIQHSVIFINHESDLYYSKDFPENISQDKHSEFKKLSEETEKVLYTGKLKIEFAEFHTFIIPIHFGKDYLGYILILTNNRLWSLFKAILSDFENYYLDDQLMHVLNIQKKIKQTVRIDPQF